MSLHLQHVYLFVALSVSADFVYMCLLRKASVAVHNECNMPWHWPYPEQQLEDAPKERIQQLK